MATTYHMVHYRKFQVTEGSSDGINLEQLCRTALDKADGKGIKLWERAEDRLFTLGGDTGGELLLNKVADLQSAIFGEICFTEKKGLQALLQLKASKKQLSNLTLAEVFGLEEREAPKGSQFIRGLGYSLIVGDHLFFVKTMLMTHDHLHGYLNWLLKDGTMTVDPYLAFNLQAEFDRSLANVGDIRRLRVAGRQAPSVVVPVSDSDEVEKVVKTRKRVQDAELKNEQARPVWEAVIGQSQTASFIETLGPGEYITADTSLSIRGKRTERTKAKFKELANEIADRGDEKVQIEASDGKVSEGDAILRTRMPFSVPHDGGTLLDFDNVADQLQEVYSRFVKDGKIDA